jgi:hypothetical protein
MVENFKFHYYNVAITIMAKYIYCHIAFRKLTNWPTCQYLAFPNLVRVKQRENHSTIANS